MAQEGISVDRQDEVTAVAISTRGEHPLQPLGLQPEKHPGVEKAEPLLDTHGTSECLLQLCLAQGDLVADLRGSVYGMLKNLSLAPTLLDELGSSRLGYLEQVEKRFRGQEAVLVDGFPARWCRHVEEARVETDEVGGPQPAFPAMSRRFSRWPRQSRRSMTLRAAKRVEIRLTGQPATLSIPSMKRIVSL